MTKLYFLPGAQAHYIENLITDTIFDNFKLSCIVMSRLKKEFETNIKKTLFGLFLLCNETEILSIAAVINFKLNVLYTIPQHRNKGYAGQLIDKITEFGLRNSVHYYSPIEKQLSTLFIKHNWIKLGDKENSDGTLDYCHKIFYKEKILTYPNTPFTSTAIINQAFINITFPCTSFGFSVPKIEGTFNLKPPGIIKSNNAGVYSR